ncbi:glycosyltransferase [Desulfovibrio cuneatus]|uniref:glycosyltransferase n=1 Tax=Desulfovibrio cuneatus TaxID=159728 RepID=UPI0004028C30|nr:glycosyltransferase [Desulfovibrio cuneatus]
MNNVSSAPVVGIVIVSYNSADAVMLTLSSIVAAQTEIKFHVALIDNASSGHERNAIKTAFDHFANNNPEWSYFQQETNLGFSGGNNIGISFFLENPSVTHICLLNADTIVTDQWLDRLIAKNCHAISPVTNKSDSEQCIPTNYTFELNEALDAGKNIKQHVFTSISEFSQKRYSLFANEVAKAEPTFFCVLFTKELVQKVGLLDTAFYPGGYEDDDYCLRAKSCGYELYIARDVFIHHWGSASFAKLDYNYFQEYAQKNRQYLEEKHSITWEIRPHKAVSSFRLDVISLLKRHKNSTEDRLFEKIFREQLTPLILHFSSEYEKLIADIRLNPSIPAALEPMCFLTSTSSSLDEKWTLLLQKIDTYFASGTRSNEQILQLEQDFQSIEDLVLRTVKANHLINAWTLKHSCKQPHKKQGKISTILMRIRKGIKCLFKARGVIFLGGYMYPEREKDGYFQRINAIDGLFTNYLRIYVDFHARPNSPVSWVSRPNADTIIFTYTGTKLHKIAIHICIGIFALRFRKLYFHSVLAMLNGYFPWLLYLPGIKGIIDVHGVVPEEFRYHNDFYSALRTEEKERFAMHHAKLVVVVSEAMAKYLQQKYGACVKGDIIVLPIFPSLPSSLDDKTIDNEKPIAIYAGGLHKWQLAPEMAKAILLQPTLCNYKIFTPQPEGFKKLFTQPLPDCCEIEISSKPHTELISEYARSHFGFILREDIVVNHVACPTKLVEYIGMGIVPIIKSPFIGDFNDKGLQYVALEDFENGKLPDNKTWQHMVKKNLAIYNEMTVQRIAAIDQLRLRLEIPAAITQASTTVAQPTIKSPESEMKESPLLSGISKISEHTPTVASSPQSAFVYSLPPCDIIMQLDNMLTGGLETVVIDLAISLQKQGYTVALLVFGNTGADAEKAQAMGLTVCNMPYGEQSLRLQLAAAKPKVVFAHYSFQGSHICAELSIPFYQVVHNVYTWLDEEGKTMLQNTIENTAQFIAVSPVVREFTVHELGVPENKCITIANGIEIQKFTPLPPEQRAVKRSAMGYSADEYIFISVASINRIKRQLTLVKSFHLATLAGVKAKLLIIGHAYDTGYLQELLQYIEQNKLQDIVQYIGHTRTPEEYYAIADAQLHGAAIEGGQLTFLEALTANLSVVTSNVGFAPLFTGHHGIYVVERNFPYKHESFNNQHLLNGGPQLIADLAASIMQAYTKRVRPNLPQEITSLFDRQKTYAAYANLVRSTLAKEQELPPVLGWCDLIENKSVTSAKEHVSTCNDNPYQALLYLAAQRSEQFAEREKQISEQDGRCSHLAATLNGVYNSKSWRITAPLRLIKQRLSEIK